MAKILILDGDHIETEINCKDERFVFLITKDDKVFHIDLTDCEIWQAKSDLSNLGIIHQRIIRNKMQPFYEASDSLGKY